MKLSSPSGAPDEFTKRRTDDDRARLTAALVATGTGDKSAFEDVYRRTSAKLFGVCLRIFGDRHEAEEALQDAYLTIWNRAGRFEAGRASPISWLVAVTRNRAIDRLRSRGQTGLTTIDEAADIADQRPLVDAALIAQGESEALDHCITLLDARDAGFIRDAFVGGATYNDLAVRDAVPLSTVKSRIRRALMTLRECLGARA